MRGRVGIGDGTARPDLPLHPSFYPPLGHCILPLPSISYPIYVWYFWYPLMCDGLHLLIPSFVDQEFLLFFFESPQLAGSWWLAVVSPSLTAPVTFGPAANLNFENLDQIPFIESLSHRVLGSNHGMTVHAPASFLNGHFPSPNGQLKIDFWRSDGSHQCRYWVLRDSTYVHFYRHLVLLQAF